MVLHHKPFSCDTNSLIFGMNLTVVENTIATLLEVIHIEKKKEKEREKERAEKFKIIYHARSMFLKETYVAQKSKSIY